jgi:ribosomal protein S18 acetylase RimI-like enzyme
MMKSMARYSIEALTPLDQSFLWEMLYQALYVPAGHAPFAREVVNDAHLSGYVKDWGRQGDVGFKAVAENGLPVGAVWLRLLKDAERGFGYVDDETPELGMALLPEYRGQGVGTSLLSHLIEAAQVFYENISLSVARENPALRLYQRHGFQVVAEHGDSLTMKRKLSLV